ncbi:MAG: VOC family protein [Candidatus Dormibacteraceae bacterium]
MVGISLNHVSISARDLGVSTRFYRDFLGLEPVPTPNFGFPVQWMRIGDLQLHLFVQPVEAPRFHHVAITVDDFEACYRRAAEMGIWDRETFGHHVYELPGGCAQMYVRDPAGNCIEIDWPDAAGLDRTVVTDLRRLEDRDPQSDLNRRSTLFLTARATRC